MPMIRAFLIRLATRPVLVPIGVGSFGLWYGGFDVAYIVTRKIATALDPAAPATTSTTNRFISSLAALSVGGVYGYAQFPTSPFKNIELPELKLRNIIRDFPTYIKSNAEVMKALNYKRGIAVFVSSGFLSGFVKSIIETYLGHHV